MACLRGREGDLQAARFEDWRSSTSVAGWAEAPTAARDTAEQQKQQQVGEQKARPESG